MNEFKDLNELADAIARENEAKGFNMNIENKAEVITALALITTEVAEAIEEVRMKEVTLLKYCEGKPCGLYSEIIDILIRTLDLMGRYKRQSKLKINFQTVFSDKLNYNKTR